MPSDPTNRAHQPRETYWSRFADDFSRRNRYVVGDQDIEAVKARLRRLDGLGSALELGCGDGEYSPDIAAGASELVATDWSLEMVQAATARLADTCPQVTVAQVDAGAMPYDDASFDTVVMVNLLHVIADPEGTLRECRRVLRPGGRLVVLSFSAQGMGFIAKLGMVYRYLKTYGKPPAHGLHLTTESASALMTARGFEVESAELAGQTVKCVVVVGRAASVPQSAG